MIVEHNWPLKLADIWKLLTLCDKRKMLKLCITWCQNILDGLMPITFLQYCSFGRSLEPGIGIDLPIQMGVVLNCRVNVSVGPQEDRMMTSGRHSVADIYCNCCQQLVGWKYVLFTYTHLLASAFGCQYHVIRLSQKLFNPIYWLWQESAYEKSQKYKEGKFILER